MDNKALKKRLYLIRLNIYNYNPFYGSYLMNMQFEVFDNKDNEKDVKIDKNIVYISTHYIECATIPYISNIIIDLLKKHIDDALSLLEEDEKIFSYDTESGENDLKDYATLESMKFKSTKVDDTFIDSVENIKMTIKTMNQSGLMHLIPGKISRLIKVREKKKVNWREVLNKYLMVENSDYSFCPPDRRISGDFFLPDFNVSDEKIEKVIFMIDVSSSMKEEKVSQIFNEVKNIYAQFKGKVDIYVGCFDAYVKYIKRCETLEDFDKLDLKGGGTTSFVDIFDRVDRDFRSEDIKLLVILTDGMGEEPKNNYIPNIPVLWFLTDFDRVVPFGDKCLY